MSKKPKSNMKNKTNNNKYALDSGSRIGRINPWIKALILVLLLAVSGVAAYSIGLQSVKRSLGLDISFLPAGNGYCSVLKAGTGIIVIDAGDEAGVSVLLDYLHSNNIRKLDALIITSDDEACCGGAAELISNIAIEQLVTPDFGETPSAAWQKALGAAEKESLTPTEISEDSAFILQNASYLLLPEKDADREDASSLLISVMYGSDTAFFTGNASAKSVSSYLESDMAASHDLLVLPQNGRWFEGEDALLLSSEASSVIIPCEAAAFVDSKVTELIASMNAAAHFTCNGEVHASTSGEGWELSQ